MAPFAYIAVFRGDPLDYQKYRHTSIWVKFDDGQSIMVDITGAPTSYDISVRPGYDPSRTRSFVGFVEVGPFRKQVTPAQITSLAYETPPNNREASYNCQTWVDDALMRMVQKGWLSRDQASKAIDQMVEKTMEAADEPEP